MADAPAYAHGLAEPLAALIVSLAPAYDAILAPSTANGKNVMPRVAALLDVMQISDIIKVVGARHLRAADLRRQRHRDGRVDRRRRWSSPCAPPPSARPAPGGSAPIEHVAAAADPGVSAFVGEELAKSDRPELTAAKIIVSGGRAMQKAENFKTYIEPLADKLGAAMGASRAAVDAGYAPNDWQVGQTGKIVAPELYIAVGISGAIQHLAGMKDSKVIVAINKDAEAPIFQVADYGLVADLYQALPELDGRARQDRAVARTVSGSSNERRAEAAPAQPGSRSPKDSSMPIYKAPVADTMFLLTDVFRLTPL